MTALSAGMRHVLQIVGADDDEFDFGQPSGGLDSILNRQIMDLSDPSNREMHAWWGWDPEQLVDGAPARLAHRRVACSCVVRVLDCSAHTCAAESAAASASRAMIRRYCPQRSS